jgi:TolB protein
MSKRVVRLSRVLSVGTFALTLPLAGGGCADMMSSLGMGEAPVAQQRQVAQRPAVAQQRSTATLPPPQFQPKPAARATTPAYASAGAPQPASTISGGGVGMSGADAQAGPDDVRSATEPRWGNSDRADTGGISNINVFGEMQGAPESSFKPVGNSGFQQHTDAEEGEDSDVAVDPSGKWLAYTSTRHNEAGDIYLQRVDGTSVTQLTNDAAKDAFPTFSTDGKWIAFASTRSGSWQIYRMDLDGRGVVQVTNGPMQCIHPSFSPDGTRLVYSALGARSDQWEVWVINLLTDEKRQIGYGLFPAWSPDHSVDRIAYQRGRQRGSRWFSLWTMELQNGEGRRNTEVAVSSNAAIVTPCWSPDGKKIAFTTVVQPANGAAQAAAGQQDIWMIDADGANKHRLTDGNGTNLTPAWAANNRVYFISNRGGNEAVWSAHADAVDAFTAAARATAKQPVHAETGKPANDPFETADTHEAAGH